MPLHGGVVAAPPGARRLRFEKVWRRARRVWITLGIGATVVFVGWSLVAYRASAGEPGGGGGEPPSPPRLHPLALDRGGHHSQFGWYGFQPGDRRATLPAAAQRQRMTDGVLAALRSASPAEVNGPITEERP